ncbi:hypothetical protein GW17_00051948 [Ensete ventricosum]|nr:hypothetical protein GW17_00051948 [Ensete ventricosum]
MQCSLISGYFHDFTEERTMMLKVFPDDNLESTAHDRKKEQEKGIHMTPTVIMPSISMLVLPERGNVFVLGAYTSRDGINNALALFPYHHCAAVAVVACAGQPPLRQALLPSGLQERSPLQAVTLAAGLPLAASQRAAAPCGRCLWALVVVGRPLVGGLGRNQPGRGWPALHGGWSWLVTPPPRCLWRD